LKRTIARYQEGGVDEFIIEEYIQGIDASTSVLSTGEQATLWLHNAAANKLWT